MMRVWKSDWKSDRKAIGNAKQKHSKTIGLVWKSEKSEKSAEWKDETRRECPVSKYLVYTTYYIRYVSGYLHSEARASLFSLFSLFLMKRISSLQ